ncbi:MAG: outer membrane beta-barrel protein [Gemmatimonadaceae bacterium]
MRALDCAVTCLPTLALVCAVPSFPFVAHGQGSAVDSVRAASDTTVKISFDGFVDGYYAWDFGRPTNFDRSFAGGALFTTQPARHNEFNVNLAYVALRLDGARIRGRIALQAGTSVQFNYSGEPTNGQVSGASLARNIQEAFVGVMVSPNIWIDGGIFYSHMGMEGWASRDNPTYTRSLVADYSPYYQSGVRATWAATSKLTAQLDIVNGWQNISENNNGKGAGVRLDYAKSSSTTFSYYNLVSQEAGTRLRVFNGVGAKSTVGRTTLLGQFDFGMQDNSNGSGGSANWYGVTAIVRQQITPTVAISGRVERFDDQHQIIIATGSVDAQTNGPFRANGASIGLDWSPQRRLAWRSELRAFQNTSAVFPNGSANSPSKNNAMVVSSLALTF